MKDKPTMKEQIISFECAKLAKEKGVNEYLNNIYYTADGRLLPIRDLISSNLDDCFNAPTQSLLQRWLREKRGIYISIKLEIAYIPRGWYCYIDADSYRLWGSDAYKTYEKALGVGLIKALKLI